MNQPVRSDDHLLGWPDFIPVWLSVLCLCASVRDPCEDRNGGCAQLCRSEGGLVHCSCRPGFTLAGDGRKCEGEELNEIWGQLCYSVREWHLSLCKLEPHWANTALQSSDWSHRHSLPVGLSVCYIVLTTSTHPGRSFEITRVCAFGSITLGAWNPAPEKCRFEFLHCQFSAGATNRTWRVVTFLVFMHVWLCLWSLIWSYCLLFVFICLFKTLHSLWVLGRIWLVNKTNVSEDWSVPDLGFVLKSQRDIFSCLCSDVPNLQWLHIFLASAEEFVH